VRFLLTATVIGTRYNKIQEPFFLINQKRCQVFFREKIDCAPLSCGGTCSLAGLNRPHILKRLWERKKPRRNEAFWPAAYKQPILGSAGALVELYADTASALPADQTKAAYTSYSQVNYPISDLSFKLA